LRRKEVGDEKAWGFEVRMFGKFGIRVCVGTFQQRYFAMETREILAREVVLF
jgi:hypothetical protein